MTQGEPSQGVEDRWGRISTAVHREAKRLADVRGWSRYVIAFGLGALTATSLAPFYILPALVMGFSGLVILLDGASQSQTPKRMAFLTGWAFGFGYFLLGMYWLGFAFLVQADQFAWMIPIAIPAFTGFLGLFCAIPALLAMFRWQNGLSSVLLLAAFWAAFEFLRGNILTGLPWNLTSQSFAGTAFLAQPVAWVGPYGYSLILLFLAMLPAAALAAPGRLRPAPLLGFAAGVMAILVFGAARLSLNEPDNAPAGMPMLVVVQPNVAQKDKLDPERQAEAFEAMVRMTGEAAATGQNTIAVWPENAHPFLANAPDATTFFAQSLPEETALVAGTIRAWEDDGHTRYGNSVAIFGRTTGGEKPLEAIYDKHHLVPFGEYLPFRGLLTRLGLSQLSPVGEGFTPGPGPQVYENAGLRFAPLICYEDVFPRRLYPTGDRPDLLVVVTNDAWFGDNAGPRQHLDISRMRAIESGLPMARSANTGISTIFDARGRMVESLPLYEQGVISAPMPSVSSRPFYDRLGEFPFFFLLLAAASASFYVRVARNS
ncbi:MAG: apolipoprotein N-acyltransferase [Pseudomonadota bacterium]